VTVKAPEEIPYCTGTDVISNRIALRLNVNPVQPKRILVNHAVNSIVATAAKRTPRTNGGAARTHADKHIDDEALKKIWWCGAVRSNESCASDVSICLCATRIISSGVCVWFANGGSVGCSFSVAL
jgi:hypothetical protein